MLPRLAVLLILSGSSGSYAHAGVHAATRAELAGNLLDAYPFFDHVSAFNHDATIHVAIDPTRYPVISGASADLYVVAARTAAEWSSDPTLVDARPGGAQAVVFSGATIQDNAVLAVAAGELDAGPALGMGYDVVLDLDLDGLLGATDILDGAGAAAGFYVVRDTTLAGPWPTTSITYSGGAFLGQKTWYPSDIATLGPLPLVVISHGNGHNYTWYDYLQSHLASYGYVVMSHQNNTMPGIESASTTTLTNTDYFLGHLGAIGGGIFDGHVDGQHITWIGHSRGGEGVCRAYDRLFDGDYVPDHFGIDDVVLVSSIAPNDYLGRDNSNPHDVDYHLLHGTADGDNGGWPNLENDAPFHVYERAVGNRQVTHVHGADHNDFNCCGFDDFAGPPGTAIGRPEAQRVAKASYLALIRHYVNGNIPAGDYLWRQYEVLRPIGVNADTIVDREYVRGPAEDVVVIDDFQSSSTLNVSSSGGAVSFDVANPWEGLLDDSDGTFTWSSGDPMNGMSRGRTNDLNRGLVFDWSPGAERFLEFEMVPAARDLSERLYLSFRACQGTRHPETVAELAQLTFTVTLRDGVGVSSSIDIGAYGAGIQEPYQRTGSGNGAGWQSEFETIRIRLTDFQNNGSNLDLTDIEAVRFEFGAAHGSSRGRLGFDDLALDGIRDTPQPTVPALSAWGFGVLALATVIAGALILRRRPRHAVWLIACLPLASSAAPPNVPGTPVGVIDILYARPFTLEHAYHSEWQAERPLVTGGTLLVLEVDPALVYPRQALQPVLFVGDRTAERLNVGYRSGRVVAVVPGRIDLSTAQVWFGQPDLPERVDAATIAREQALATAAGITPLPAERIEQARKTGGAVLSLRDRDALHRFAAQLIAQYSVEERELADNLSAPRVEE